MATKKKKAANDDKYYDAETAINNRMAEAAKRQLEEAKRKRTRKK